MADDPTAASAREYHGALVGWVHHQFGDRFILGMQSVRTTQQQHEREIDLSHFVMSPTQALQLANYIYQVLDQEPPNEKDRGWFRRVFG